MAYKDGVSIIVTVFNKQDYIEKTLKSIFKQMNSLTQLIVVNDGSTDNSLKLIKKNLQNLKYENKFCFQKVIIIEQGLLMMLLEDKKI